MMKLLNNRSGMEERATHLLISQNLQDRLPPGLKRSICLNVRMQRYAPRQTTLSIDPKLGVISKPYPKRGINEQAYVFRRHDGDHPCHDCRLVAASAGPKSKR